MEALGGGHVVGADLPAVTEEAVYQAVDDLLVEVAGETVDQVEPKMQAAAGVEQHVRFGACYLARTGEAVVLADQKLQVVEGEQVGFARVDPHVEVAVPKMQAGVAVAGLQVVMGDDVGKIGGVEVDPHEEGAEQEQQAGQRQRADQRQQDNQEL